MRLQRLITVSKIAASLWICEASLRDASSIPRSNHRAAEHRSYPPWNASPNIDDDGFLLPQYDRLPGDWENDFKIRKKHQNEVRTPSKVRQVPGDGNVRQVIWCQINPLSVCCWHHLTFVYSLLLIVFISFHQYMLRKLRLLRSLPKRREPATDHIVMIS